jgi:hypothetical protein
MGFPKFRNGGGLGICSIAVKPDTMSKLFGPIAVHRCARHEPELIQMLSLSRGYISIDYIGCPTVHGRMKSIRSLH